MPPERRKALERAALWSAAKARTPYLAAQRGEAVFLVPTLADPELFVDTGRQAEFVGLERACAILRDAGRPTAGQTIVDVGAHIGTTTITALREHGFAQAVAIEPDPENLRLLRANVALNGLEEHVTVVPAAISSEVGRQLFSRGSREDGDYRWTKGGLTDEPSSTAVAVDTVTLDGLVEEGLVDPRTTGLLWLDCNRREEAALSAASAFLERRVPIILATARGRVTESSPLLAELGRGYEQIVDLRSPNLDETASTWRPTMRPVDDLVTLPERSDKKVTDVLVL